jgi:hypothetical protein
MVEMNLGSTDLKKSLPYGAIKEIAKTFDCSIGWVGKVVTGQTKGNPEILECANRISKAYSDSNIQESISEILKDYQQC